VLELEYYSNSHSMTQRTKIVIDCCEPATQC
jgi:hypothetical protein